MVKNWFVLLNNFKRKLCILLGLCHMENAQLAASSLHLNQWRPEEPWAARAVPGRRDNVHLRHDALRAWQRGSTVPANALLRPANLTRPPRRRP